MNFKILALLLPKIKNTEYPVCKNCIHYIEHREYLLSRCAFFGEKNIITGEIKYDYADLTRNDECGKTGKYYKEK
jgi:hypothetical protein